MKLAKREMFLMAQSVVDKIIVRFGYEKLGEFTFLLSQYCAWWDNHGTGDGFNFSKFSEPVLIYFDTIRDEIDEKHRQFIVQGEQMAKLAKERWEKEQAEEKRREQKRRWYGDNKERVNQKRRKKALKDVSGNLQKMSSGVSSDKLQSIDSQSIAKNDAARIMNYEFMNHKNIIESYDMRARDAVDNLVADTRENHKPSDGLTGHNLAEGSVINGKNKHKKHKKQRTRKPETQKENLKHNPLSPARQLPQGEQKLGKEEVRPVLERLTVYGDTWIKIGDDFEIDLFDPYFEKFSRARKFLINGFENWCRKNLSGERHDKWWLAKTLGVNFANRQGDSSYMVDNPEENLTSRKNASAKRDDFNRAVMKRGDGC